MRGREPFLLGTIGAVVGIVLAVVIFGGSGNGGLAGASASPGLPSLSIAPSASLVAVGSVAPTTDVSVPPVTVPPTAPPTAAPTPPTKTPKPTATPNTNPVIISFEAPKQEDCTNDSAGRVTLKWSVKNATGVSLSIDGPGVYKTYSGLSNAPDDIPFGCSDQVLQHSYTLTTVGGTGPPATVTRIIKTRAPSIVSFTVSKPDCSGGETFVGINISFEIRAATGARLDRDGAPYSTYNTKATDDIVMYDCSQNDQEGRLTTPGGYGPAATKAIKVSKN